jgi:hypothetical protein
VTRAPTGQKDGVSALSLQRTLEIGSYATACAMLHRPIGPGTPRPAIGGEEAGLAGGRAKGKKALVAVAVEVHEPVATAAPA